MNAALPAYHAFELPEEPVPVVPFHLTVNQSVSTALVEEIAEGRGVQLAASVKLRCRDRESKLPTPLDPAAHPAMAELATGLGELCSATEGRAILFTRLRSLALGYSGATLDLLQLMAQWLSVGHLAPVVPLHGAGSERSPLAHLALVLAGDGECSIDGQLFPAGLVARREGFPVWQPRASEVPIFSSGTAVMTALASLNDRLAHRLIRRAASLGVISAELLPAGVDCFHPLTGRVRPHPGLQLALDEMQLGSSPRSGQTAEELLCLPPSFGAAWDVLAFHGQIVECELNSAADSILHDPATGETVHTAEANGHHVALASDALSNAIVQVASVTGRLVSALSATAGQPAGALASMAHATVSEMRTQAHPIACQDVASPGSLAARQTARLLNRLADLLAVQAVALARGMEARTGHRFSPTALQALAEIRRHAPPGSAQPLREGIRHLAIAMRSRHQEASRS